MALAGSGLYIIYRTWRDEARDQPFDSRWVVFGLPISLSLDNLLAGAGLGMLGLPILLSALVIGAISCMMCVAGLLIGNTVARYSHFDPILKRCFFALLGSGTRCWRLQTRTRYQI